MRHSLSSRFQGVLCGSLIGEQLVSSQISSIETQIRLTIIQNLLNSEELNDYILPKEVNSSVAGEIALLSLPIIMFFHESPSLLTDKLQKIGKIWQCSESVLQGLLLWGRFIALALTEKLHPENFFSLTLDSDPKTPLTENLCLVHEYIKEAKPLQQLVFQLSQQEDDNSAFAPWACHEAIVYALYCFASTPNDFLLSIRRASKCPTPLLTVSLTGALAGGYNGVNGIPLSWRLAAQKIPLFQDSQQAAKLMFNHWVGIYEPSQLQISPAIACYATGVMQARSSLKIVSQS